MNIEFALRVRYFLTAIALWFLWSFFAPEACAYEGTVMNAADVTLNFRIITTDFQSVYYDSAIPHHYYSGFSVPGEGVYYFDVRDGSGFLFSGFVSIQQASRILFDGSRLTVTSPKSPVVESAVPAVPINFGLVLECLAAGFGFVIVPMTILIVMRKIRQGISLGGEI